MKKLITTYDSDGSVAEAYRTLRTNIRYRNVDEDLKIINVVSTTNGERKTSVITNLANTYAQLHKKVLLIDLDLRKPAIHKKLGIRNKLGIVDLINGTVTFEECCFVYSKHLHVLTAGSKIMFQSEFLQSEILAMFIKKIRDHYDYILIDCPPIGLVSDGIIISTLSDGTIFVCESGKNNPSELRHTKELLEEVECNILGVVLTKVHQNHNKYYSYGYH